MSIVELSPNPTKILLPVADEATGVGRLIRKLAAIYPAQITGKNLAPLVADQGSGFPFASLCFHYLRANEALAPFGWQAVRSGETPQSTYFLKRL